MPKIPSGSLFATKMRAKNIQLPVVWTPNPSLLLHPNIPKPLHGVAPRTVMGSAWWAKEKKACYKSTDYHCEACGVHKSCAKYHQWLEAHEVYEVDYERGTSTYVRATPLCHFCHNYIHDGRMQALLERGELHHAKYSAILQHGDEVLNNAGTKRESRAVREAMLVDLFSQGRLAEWHDWRMVIGDQSFPPIYSTIDEWERFHRLGAST